MFAKIKLLHKYRRRNVWQLLYGSKWVAAGALIFQPDGRFLLIKHRQRAQWEYPMGMTDGNESPLETARREIREEVGLQLHDLKLLGVDFFHRRTPNGNLALTFAAQASQDDAARVHIEAYEATEYRWVTRAEAQQLVEPWLQRRLNALLAAYDADRPVYLDEGYSIAH